MPDLRRANCRECGQHKAQVGDISWSGLCSDCARRLFITNLEGLHTKSGVPWQRYRLGVSSYVFGPEVTAALFKAGVFAPPLDEAAEGR
jgi:hypothetical protein